MSKYAIYGNGNPVAAFNPRTARAYCEARAVAIGGGLITDNPFTVGTERENSLAWEAGFNEALTVPASETFCGGDGVIVPPPVPQVAVPNIVGLTAVDAGVAITGANLIVGTVTGDLDPIVTQTPIAGTLVDEGTAVGYDLTVGIAVPTLIGLTAVAADSAITGAGLTKGAVTGTVDPVATQTIVAGTLVVAGTAVGYGLTS